jgi:hypothetical protein
MLRCDGGYSAGVVRSAIENVNDASLGGHRQRNDIGCGRASRRNPGQTISKGNNQGIRSGNCLNGGNYAIREFFIQSIINFIASDDFTVIPIITPYRAESGIRTEQHENGQKDKIPNLSHRKTSLDNH